MIGALKRIRKDEAKGLAQHLTRFLAAGAMAFLTDAAILALLVHGLGFGPLLGRVGSVAVAIFVSWQAHRRLTFAVTRPPSLAEFLRFVASASISLTANYACYAAIMLARPATEPLGALFLASLVAMFVSYAGLRLGVFGKPEIR